jgi:calcineurin-like phosphoesterase family protein
MNTFVTADTHFDHPDIILHCKRPWYVNNPKYDPIKPYDFRDNNPLMVTKESLEAHNQTLVSNWNKMVSKKDRVIIVGDFAFANHTKWASLLNGKKVLVMGNHDEMNQESMKSFDEVYDFGCVKKIRTGKNDENGKAYKEKVTFCHYAMRSWPDSWNGSASLHGHGHFRMPELDSLLSFDIGVDGWGYIPVPWEAIQIKIDVKRELIRARLGGYEVNDGAPRGLYSPDPAQRVIDTRNKNLDILRSIGIGIDENFVAIPPERVHHEKLISAIVAVAGNTNQNGVVYSQLPPPEGGGLRF